MSQALYTSMTGLNVAQQAINVVSNNVANINTTAYKSADARFSTLFSNTLSAGNAPTNTSGGTNPKQIGLGVQLEAITRNFDTGSFLSTGINGDSMISGNGYYTVMDSSGNISLTRDGAFTLDANGNMITATGNKVLGAKGVQEKTASQTPIHIPQSIVPTTEGADLTQDRSLSSLNEAFFTEGNINFTITADGVTVECTTDDISVDGSVSDYCTAVAKAINDKIPSSGWTGGQPQIKIDPQSDGTFQISWTGGSDGAQLTFLEGSTSNFSQTCGYSEVIKGTGYEDTGKSNELSMVVSVDPGDNSTSSKRTDLQEYNIGADGTIEVSYSNGDKFTVVYNKVAGEFGFQYVTSAGVEITGTDVTMNPNVATADGSSLVMQIATVTNEAGLLSQADNLWKIGPDSGNVTYTIAGQMGAGTLVTGGLEGSNVDLARELSNMIIQQRAINANSRVFSTASTVLETLSNLGR